MTSRRMEVCGSCSVGLSAGKSKICCVGAAAESSSAVESESFGAGSAKGGLVINVGWWLDEEARSEDNADDQAGSEDVEDYETFGHGGEVSLVVSDVTGSQRYGHSRSAHFATSIPSLPQRGHPLISRLLSSVTFIPHPLR